LIKSPGQFSGYYKQPELTAESFTPDGYFHTGDLGERREDGMLKITGRAKELFKTAKGKYVAPAPIENHINAHPQAWSLHTWRQRRAPGKPWRRPSMWRRDGAPGRAVLRRPRAPCSPPWRSTDSRVWRSTPGASGSFGPHVA
jgi:acyl-CoA synthetase (AMP-forming)/AMP-acid ligase II